MRITYFAVILITTGLLTACNVFNDPENGAGDNPPSTANFEDVSSSNLPLNSLSGNSMDARPADLDGDGDLDIVVAIEFGRNIILINNGNGDFQDESNARLPAQNFDSEDAAIADFDQDTDQDLFFASEDNLTNEFYVNNGTGNFSDLSNRIAVTGRSNAAISPDIDQDGDPDLLIGNNGQNVVLINNGNAIFSDQTPNRLPQQLDITQDLETGDIDGDGDPDLLVGNEGDNRLLINTGSGFFVDQTSTRIPLIGAVEETREVDLGDVDGDGDLDIYYANVAFIQSNADLQDRLLINNGQGVFSDGTSSRLPEVTTNTVDADFTDIDGDGSLDILAGDSEGGVFVFINDGNGTFSDETEEWIPSNVAPNVFDFEVADFNGDGRADIYIASRGSADVLLLRR